MLCTTAAWNSSTNPQELKKKKGERRGPVTDLVGTQAAASSFIGRGHMGLGRGVARNAAVHGQVTDCSPREKKKPRGGGMLPMQAPRAQLQLHGRWRLWRHCGAVPTVFGLQAPSSPTTFFFENPAKQCA
jgi:hypothetical protein